MLSATFFLRDGGLFRGLKRLDVEDKSRLDAVDAHLLAALEGETFGGVRAPELAVDEDLAVAAELADLTDDRLRPDRDRAAAYLDSFRHCEEPRAAEDDRDRGDQPRVRVVRGGRVPEQQQRPDDEDDQARDRQRPVARHVSVDHE